MKQAWSDLKSYVTILLITTLVALLIITAVKGNWEMFQLMFTLFASVTSSVVTYYFTKKASKKVEEK